MNLSNPARQVAGAIAGVVAIAALSLFTMPAHAQALQTFAEFGRTVGTGTGSFRFNNNGANSTFSMVNSTVPVRFQYDTANSYGQAGDSIPAIISITANVAAPATLVNGTITQYLSNITISFTAVNPQGGLSNLLTANFGASDGSISFASGAQAGGQATLSAGHTNPVGVANYSSDFLDFTNNAQKIFQSEQFALSFSAVNNTTAGGNGLTINSNGYLDSFKADGTGTFSASSTPNVKPTTVPEPASLALMGMALTAGFVRVRRRA